MDEYTRGYEQGVKDALAPVEKLRDDWYKNSYRIWAKQLGRAISKGYANVGR